MKVLRTLFSSLFLAGVAVAACMSSAYAAPKDCPGPQDLASARRATFAIPRHVTVPYSYETILVRQLQSKFLKNMNSKVPNTPEFVWRNPQVLSKWNTVTKKYLIPASDRERDFILSRKELDYDYRDPSDEQLEILYWTALSELDQLPESDAKYDAITAVALKQERVLNPHISKLNNLWHMYANEKSLLRVLSSQDRPGKFELDFQVARRLEFAGKNDAAEKLYKNVVNAAVSKNRAIDSYQDVPNSEYHTSTFRKRFRKNDSYPSDDLIQTNFEVYRDFLYRQERDNDLATLDKQMKLVGAVPDHITSTYGNAQDPNIVNVPLYLVILPYDFSFGKPGFDLRSLPDCPGPKGCFPKLNPDFNYNPHRTDNSSWGGKEFID